MIHVGLYENKALSAKVLCSHIHVSLIEYEEQYTTETSQHRHN